MVHSLHWDMNKCNSDIKQGDLKVEVQTHAIQTVHLLWVMKKGKTKNLKIDENGVVSKKGRD